MGRATPSTGHAWISDDCSKTITCSANLLDHERALSDCLVTLSATASASRWRSTWLRFCAFACRADIGSPKIDHSLCPIHSVQEFYLEINHDVLTFSLRFSSSPSLLAAEHSFELVKNITERLALTTLRSSELFRKALKTGEALATSKGIGPSKWILASKGILCLLISRHSSLIVDAALSLVAEGFVRVVDFGELFFCFVAWIHIWMIFLRKLEVGLLDVGLRGVSVQSQHGVVVFIFVFSTSSGATSSPSE